MRAIHIDRPGLFTTVQDHGRKHFLHMGVPPSGVMDQYAADMANILVGNDQGAALLELTVAGPAFQVSEAMDMALTGADMEIRINGERQPAWESIALAPGDQVEIGSISRGCRSYLALGGGIDLPRVMDSFATHVGGKTGGFKGRALKAGDQISIKPAPLLSAPRKLPMEYIPDLSAPKVLRAIPGPQDDFFEKDILFNGSYTVTQKSDRMGYRLEGPPLPILEGKPQSIVSEALVPGSIQVPPDGQPIILFGEQTVGGYAKIATVISLDLPVVAQALPGETLTFKKISLDRAQEALAQEKDRRQKIQALWQKS